MNGGITTIDTITRPLPLVEVMASQLQEEEANNKTKTAGRYINIRQITGPWERTKEAPLECGIQLQQLAENVQQQQQLLTQVQAQLEFIQLMVNTLLLPQLDTTEDATIDTQDNLEDDHKKGSSNLIVKIANHHNQSFDNNTRSNIYGNGYLDAWTPLTLQCHRTRATSSDNKDNRIGMSDIVTIIFSYNNNITATIGITHGNYFPKHLHCLDTTSLRQSTPIHRKAWLCNNLTPIHRKAWLCNHNMSHWRA